MQLLLIRAGGRGKPSKAGEDEIEHRPDVELGTMGVDQWLENAPIISGDDPWPSPEQIADSNLELQIVSTNSKLPQLADLYSTKGRDCS